MKKGKRKLIGIIIRLIDDQPECWKIDKQIHDRAWLSMWLEFLGRIANHVYYHLPSATMVTINTFYCEIESPLGFFRYWYLTNRKLRNAFMKAFHTAPPQLLEKRRNRLNELVERLESSLKKEEVNFTNS